MSESESESWHRLFNPAPCAEPTRNCEGERDEYRVNGVVKKLCRFHGQAWTKIGANPADEAARLARVQAKLMKRKRPQGRSGKKKPAAEVRSPLLSGGAEPKEIDTVRAS